MSSAPERFDGVSVVTKANIFFDGRVVSHTVHLADGSRKSLGLIFPGSFTFTTGAPEEMAIVAGSCRWRLAGETAWKDCGTGASFAVPGGSAFDVAVESGIAEYVCSFG